MPFLTSDRGFEPMCLRTLEHSKCTWSQCTMLILNLNLIIHENMEAKKKISY
ncbi:hypothetical protein E2C01_036277 [Portunus trituberculatus]|uniref:Uncharacterized protein n=1 Tax=Portunus trituberculatus TaxID=210409 RepID=A0A5B7F5D8_PORTR|nr:hypothetical protein [Portunus trituberculatus]